MSKKERAVRRRRSVKSSADVFGEGYSAEDIKESIRALGGDPDVLGQRGVEIVSRLLKARKSKTDLLAKNADHLPLGDLDTWSNDIGFFVSSHSDHEGPTNPGFEFRQLLRAYRSGIISAFTFETELAHLETVSSAGREASDFEVLGRIYASEREAVAGFLETIATAETAGAEAIRGWLQVCKLDCVRGGLKMVLERESYHGRAFAERLAELGGTAPPAPSEEMRKNIAFLSDPDVSDLEKLQRTAIQVPDPDEAIRPMFEFAERLKEDQQTREMVKLFAQDELSTLKWQSSLSATLTEINKKGQLDATP